MCFLRVVWVRSGVEYDAEWGWEDRGDRMLTGWEAAQVHMSKSVIAVYHSNCECNISLAVAGAGPMLSYICILATSFLDLSLLLRETKTRNAKGQMMIGSDSRFGFIIFSAERCTKSVRSFVKYRAAKKKKNRNKNLKQIYVRFQTILRTISTWLATQMKLFLFCSEWKK